MRYDDPDHPARLLSFIQRAGEPQALASFPWQHTTGHQDRIWSWAGGVALSHIVIWSVRSFGDSPLDCEGGELVRGLIPTARTWFYHGISTPFCLWVPERQNFEVRVQSKVLDSRVEFWGWKWTKDLLLQREEKS